MMDIRKKEFGVQIVISHNSKIMKNKLLKIILVVFAPVYLLSANTLAQGTGTNINDIMGEQPGSSYYQSTSTGTQTQGSSSVNDSASASVLNQEPNTNLSVDSGPLNTSTKELALPQTSYAWVWYLAIALIFLAITAMLFMLGMKKQRQELQVATNQETAEPEELKKPVSATKQSVKPKAKKSSNKKTNKSKVKRGKKKH